MSDYEDDLLDQSYYDFDDEDVCDDAVEL